jgi:hypothetical protein
VVASPEKQSAGGVAIAAAIRKLMMIAGPAKRAAA